MLKNFLPALKGNLTRADISLITPARAAAAVPISLTPK